MSERWLATGRQADYITDLAAQVRQHIADGDEAAQQLERAVSNVRQLSKRDASDLIEALIGSLERVGARAPKRSERTSNIVAMPTRSPAQVEAQRMRDRVAKQHDAYDALQTRLHHAMNDHYGPRPVPEGRGAPMKIWKEVANRVNRSDYFHDISSGWRWKCSHSKHRSPTKGGSFSGYSSTQPNAGFEKTFKLAQAHWEKYHAGEE